MAVADQTQALWQEFRKTKDQELRDRLILTYAPLVKFVAGRVGASLPSHVDEQDLVSYGLLGLIGAIERFDPDREIKFETFAMARIRGAIIDELRSLDWVPRSVRTRARQIERAIAALEKELHRAPTDEEIAKKLGVTEEELDDSLLEISRSSVGALDELWSPSAGGDSIALIDTIEDETGPDPEVSLEQAEVKEALAEAISDLPEREKLVVTLYYYEELTLREIGEVLGVTESRVSQLHTKAILRLKAHLSGATRANRPRRREGPRERAFSVDCSSGVVRVSVVAHGLEVVRRCVVRDVRSELHGLHVCGAEVEPRPDAGLDDLVDRLREAGERTRAGHVVGGQPGAGIHEAARDLVAALRERCRRTSAARRCASCRARGVPTHGRGRAP